MQKLQLTKKYERYPEYKDSGVEWLGEIPVGWKSKKIKHVAEIIPSNVDKLTTEGQERVRLCNYVDVYKNETIKKAMIENLMVASASNLQIKKLSLLADDVIITKDSETPDDIGIPAYVPKKLEGVVCGYHLAIIRPHKVYGGYLFRFFQSHTAKTEYFLSANGLTRYAIGIGAIGNAIFPVPTEEEQTKIAAYLDEKISVIDRTIEGKKKLIELLREKRTAVINQAVIKAKGEVVKIKHCVSVNPSKKVVSLTGSDGPVSFVPMEAISENGALGIQEKSYKEVKDGFTYFENNDVVLAKITPCYENGKAGVMRELKNGFGFGTTEFMVLRTNRKILPEYLYFVIFSDKFRKQGEIEMRGSAGQKRVTKEFVCNYEFNLPPISEQQKITEKLTERTMLMDEALSLAEKSIETLQEFKSSLISHVVTGKVRV